MFRVARRTVPAFCSQRICTVADDRNRALFWPEPQEFVRKRCRSLFLWYSTVARARRKMFCVHAPNSVHVGRTWDQMDDATSYVNAPYVNAQSTLLPSLAQLTTKIRLYQVQGLQVAGHQTVLQPAAGRQGCAELTACRLGPNTLL